MARGLNFAVSSNVIPKQQILAEIEKGIQKLPEHSANLFRNQVVSVLNNKRKLKKNLTNNEKKALIDLSKNNEISICKADKGNCTVILDRTDYYEKLLLLLKDETTYKAIKQDQTKSIERRLNAFIFDLLKRTFIFNLLLINTFIFDLLLNNNIIFYVVVIHVHHVYMVYLKFIKKIFP